MPNPLSQVCNNATVIMSNIGDRVLLSNPALASHAMQAVASWSDVEFFLESLFTQMMGGPESVASAAFGALDGKNPKNAALRAVAQSVLNQDALDLFNAILKVANSAQSQRDRLAHWTWGYSPNLQDAFLLADPRSIKTEAGMRDLSNYMVYRERDFAEIYQLNEQIAGWGLLLRFILSNHPANANGELVRQLKQEPRIAQALPTRQTG